MKDKPVILIVDDQPQNIILLEALLIPQGYEIVKAANGEEALGKLSDNQIDLILLDVKMPGMDGFEVTRRVRQDNTHRLLPIILVTVLRETEDRVKGIEAGCDDFISMPDDKMELLPRVRSLLKVKAYNDLMSNYRKELESEITRSTEQLKHALENLQQDITDRKQAEEALRENEEKYRWLVDNMADVITVMDMNLRFTYVSPSIMRMRGYTPEEALAQTFEQIMTPESLQISAKVFEEEMRLEASGTADPDRIRSVEVEQYRKDGSIVLMENHLSFLRDEAKKPLGIISVSHDITQRRRAEEAIKESENKYRLLADNVNDVIFVLDMNLKYSYVSPSVKILRGYEPEEVLKQQPSDILAPSSLDLAMRALSEIMELEKSKSRDLPVSKTLQLEMIRKDGTTVWTEVKFSFIRDNNQQSVGILGLTRDITERRRAEEALNKAKTLLDKTFASMDEAIFIVDSNTRWIIACNHATEVIFGFGEKDLIGCSTDVLHVDKLSYDLFGQELSPALDANGVFRTEFQMRRKDGSVFPTENTVTEILDDSGHRTSVVSVVRDITDRKQAEGELQRTIESLRKAFGATIQAMVSAVESRDPYTAGHQIRSANLARCIATEMGLPKEKIEGIRMAGSIHDIGKLSIPAEILSKPTKLTNIEFSLIKEHSLKGYEMLKDVESPWPLAEIVYQHHERMDGSGYPRNLKGEDILMEARILTVADVVEAMASHRPYRPAIGLNAALEEIENNKGALYDADAVDACLRLFREKGFHLEVA